MGSLGRTFALALTVAAILGALAGCGGSGDTGDGTAKGSADTTGEQSEPKTSGPGGADPQTGAQEIDPGLRRAIAEAAESGVPVRIPAKLLADPPEGAEQAEVLRSPADSYTLGLSRQKDCGLKGECTAAIFSGFSGGGELTGREVKLAEGIAGVYEPGRCGPGCRFGTVEWVQDGNRYGLAVSKLPLRKLAALANEAIAAPPLGG